MYQSASRDDFENARRKIIENALYAGRDADEATLKMQRSWSLRKALAQDVAQAALQHCLATGQDTYAYSNLAGDGISIINSLESALSENKKFDLSENAKYEFNWNFWKHDDHPHFRIREKKFPYIERYSIEEAATSYLALPYRAPLLERTLVDILIAIELYAFSKEMLEKPPMGERWLNTRAPLTQKHVLRRYIGGWFSSGVILLGLAYLAGNFGPRLIGETASMWIAGAFVVLFLLDRGFSTVMLPFAWRAQWKARKKIRDLMIAMAHTYAELNGEGQTSTRRLREVAANAADQGVVWPKPLFLVLDDNIARVGRI
jgi:hypothetical protein